MFFDKAKNENGRTNLVHLKDIRYWHRPQGGLNEVMLRMKEKNLKDPTLLEKEYIELYIGSLLGIGLQESEGLDFWIAKPEGDPPDMVFMTMMSDNKKGIYFHSREVEITRHMSDEISLLERILRKDKPYPREYILVCFIEITGQSILKDLSDKLKNKLEHIDHVFLVFHGMILSDLINNFSTEEMFTKVSVVQLSPIYDYKIFDILKCLEKTVKDCKKLVYIDGMQVYYGLRTGDTNYPKIIT